MACGIYKITNKEDGRPYIGQSKNIEQRWKAHRKGRFPEDLFTYEILIECPIQELSFWEIAWILSENACECGYNKTIGGTSLNSIVHSEEVCKKISIACKGRLSPLKGRTLSKEHVEKLSKAREGRKPNLGNCHTEETKRKISEAMKGRPCPSRGGPSSRKGTKDSVVECPHCGKVGGAVIMKRWHFDKCKEMK